MPAADLQPHATAEARVTSPARLLEALESRRGVWLVVALAAALALPSLAIGLVPDDRLAAQSVRDGRGPSALFRLPPERVALDRQIGGMSWWTNPQLDIRFFRPLSALIQYLELRSYPNAAWAMHLLSVLLYAALVAL